MNVSKIAALSLFGIVGLTASTANAGLPVPPAPTCEHRFDWPDDPAAHVLNGPLDGSFDYDFLGSAIANVSGAYSADAMSLWWDVAFAQSAYIVDTAVTGGGMVGLDGDLMVGMTTTITDSQGRVWEENVRRMRSGCDEQRILEPTTLGLSHTGTWSAGRYDYEEQRPLAKNHSVTTLIADVVGTLYPDGSSEAVASYYQSGQEANTSITVTEQRNLDGERWTHLELSSLDAARQYDTYVAPDGTITQEGYFGYDPQWDYSVTRDYAGFGEGWMESNEMELYCHLDIGAVCTRTCWNLEAVFEQIEELEDEGIEVDFEFEYGAYIEDFPPELVSNYCNSALFEDYAVLPY